MEDIYIALEDEEHEFVDWNCCESLCDFSESESCIVNLLKPQHFESRFQTVKRMKESYYGRLPNVDYHRLFEFPPLIDINASSFADELSAATMAFRFRSALGDTPILRNITHEKAKYELVDTQMVHNCAPLIGSLVNFQTIDLPEFAAEQEETSSSTSSSSDDTDLILPRRRASNIIFVGIGSGGDNFSSTTLLLEQDNSISKVIFQLI